METSYNSASSEAPKLDPLGVWGWADEPITPMPAGRSNAIRWALEDSDLPPEAGLIGEVIALAVDDIEVIENHLGNPTPLPERQRVEAISAVVFLLGPVADAYARLIGCAAAMPKVKRRALAAAGLLRMPPKLVPGEERGRASRRATLKMGGSLVQAIERNRDHSRSLRAALRDAAQPATVGMF